MEPVILLILVRSEAAVLAERLKLLYT